MQVSAHIKKLTPYKPGKPINETKREYGIEQVFKLASNENPYSPSKLVLEAIQKAALEINRYPDPVCYDLKKAYAQHYQVPEENLCFGNGSNELIDLLIRIYCEPGEKILAGDMSFIAYKICAQAARVDTIESSMGQDLKINLSDFSEKIAQHHPRLVFIANPNNPTGTYVNRSEVDQFLQRHGDDEEMLIVFDEAYFEFVQALDYPNALEYLTQYKNVVVMRTMSKVFGLAGLRLGALAAPLEVIDLVNRVRNPFNVNQLAQVAAVAALQDRDYVNQAVRNNAEGREQYYQFFASKGLKYWPSQANFVLFDPDQPIHQVNEKLLQQGVVVRPIPGVGKFGGIRLSVGASYENHKALAALDEIF